MIENKKYINDGPNTNPNIKKIPVIYDVGFDTVYPSVFINQSVIKWWVKEGYEFEDLKKEIRAFADARNWEQFHTPKNLSMAVAGEAGELVAEFQWLTPEQSMRSSMSSEKLNDVELEIADVAIYLIRLADVLGVNLAEVVRKKIAINESRF